MENYASRSDFQNRGNLYLATNIPHPIDVNYLPKNTNLLLQAIKFQCNKKYDMKKLIMNRKKHK